MKIWKLLAFLMMGCCSINAVAAKADVKADSLSRLQKSSYQNRAALIVDVCPHIKLTSFNFAPYEKWKSYVLEYEWSNVGKEAVVAFEIVTLKYDPFDAPLLGNRQIVPGHSGFGYNGLRDNGGVDYSPLKPNESADGIAPESGGPELYSAVCYISRVRLDDGTVWRVDEKALSDELKKLRRAFTNPPIAMTDDKPKAK